MKLQESIDSANTYLRDYVRLYNEIHNAARANGFIVKNLGRTIMNKEDEIPILFLTKNQGYNTKKKRVLIAAGFHGDEQSGPWAVLNWITNYSRFTDNIDVSLLPLVNPAGYISGKREDGLLKDPNRDWAKGDNVSMKSVEAILEKDLPEIEQSATDGFLSLHEDNSNDRFYVKGPKETILTDLLRGRVEYLFFATDKTQIMYKDTFEDYLHERGVRDCIVAELPGKKAFRLRVECGAFVMNEFIDYCRKKNETL